MKRDSKLIYISYRKYVKKWINIPSLKNVTKKI